MRMLHCQKTYRKLILFVQNTTQELEMKTQLLTIRKAWLPFLLALMLGISTLGGCSLLSVTQPAVSTEPEVVYQTYLVLPNLADVIARVRPSVVSISTETPGYDFFRGAYTIQGAGSGWIVDPNGLIVTNNHVVEGASVVSVTLEDGRIFFAQEIYADALSDLAVIKIAASDLPAATLGISNTFDSSVEFNNTLAAPSSGTLNTHPLRMGDWVVALGNSLGMGISATKGIVSATGISVTYGGNVLYNLIQTDAAINNGNSGGPLVNLAGEVVGISSAKVSAVGVEGMGYAISIDEAYPIIQQLIENGYVLRPDIGAALYTVNKTIASIYNLAVDYGALVTQVTRNGPADSAGLRSGDVIVAVDDIAVYSAEGLKRTLQSYEIGQEIRLTYYRDTKKRMVDVILVEA